MIISWFCAGTYNYLHINNIYEDNYICYAVLVIVQNQYIFPRINNNCWIYIKYLKFYQVYLQQQNQALALVLV